MRCAMSGLPSAAACLWRGHGMMKGRVSGSDSAFTTKSRSASVVGLSRTVGIRQERELEDDLTIVDPASVLETCCKVKLLRATRAGNIGHDERGEHGFVSHVRDDVLEGRGSNALTLKLGVDHQQTTGHLR